ncbi:MAG: PadR family transcriptional regulator [Terrimesophilobacter sp.]
MNTDTTNRGSGPFRGSHGGESRHSGFGLWETMEGLRSEFERRVGPRMGRGDVRTAILTLLTDEPMHGYQIINEIEKRSSGAWKPSAGSVYPTLQMLADEGLIAAKEADGRKTYSLTKAGKDEVATLSPAPWETNSSWDAARSTVLPKAASKLAQAVVQVARGGTLEQAHEAVTVIDEARRKLYAILAQD